MSEHHKLRQVIETNFRLNALQTRELSGLVHQQLSEVGGQFTTLGQQVATLGQRVATLGQRVATLSNKVDSGLKGASAQVQQLGETFQSTMNSQIERDHETLSAIRQILDNSVDLHKTAVDHERRIRRLEERAS